MNNKKFLIDNFGTPFMQKADKFIDLLFEWTKVHSMTKANSKDEILKNIVDSVYPLTKINSFDSFVDIGTGAGFPGLIIAMAKPDVKCFLVEPKAKRVAFLNFAKNTLGLLNVEVVHSRAESFNPKISIDLVTSRAVADISLLFSLTQHLKSNQTEYLFYKGSSVLSEIDTFKNLKNYEIFEFGDNRNYLYIKREGLF